MRGWIVGLLWMWLIPLGQAQTNATLHLSPSNEPFRLVLHWGTNTIRLTRSNDVYWLKVWNGKRVVEQVMVTNMTPEEPPVPGGGGLAVISPARNTNHIDPMRAMREFYLFHGDKDRTGLKGPK